MYTDKENVNILTALLVAHGVKHAVVCPGSRNAPIVHNLNECPDIHCYPITDERSAGFYALGMSQCLRQPVAVCVTSGTALLNLTPAVAEAYYQQASLVVISADRPPQWINQLDGQTLPQPDALKPFVGKAVSLPECMPHDSLTGKHTADDTHWYCNRLANEALITQHGPVHINVPISEPLFNFPVAELPRERQIELIKADATSITVSHVTNMFLQAKKPMLIGGQPMNPNMDEAVWLVGEDERYIPDFVLYTGGSIVSKRLKHFLRKAKETWIVNNTGEVTDTFQNATHVIEGDGEVMADLLRFHLEQQPHPFIQLWDELLQKIRKQAMDYEPDYSQMAAIKYFEQHIGAQHKGAQHKGSDPMCYDPMCYFHYANSTAIRLANIFAHHQVYCNRGVNGIEGSLSTAAGFSCVTEKNVFCVIGDLSFFYDQNALWNQNLRGNLRILLLNNGKGGIFNMLKGLEQSAARDAYIAAAHHTSAEGICQQNQVMYLKAENMSELQQGMEILLYSESLHPVLLEVFTDASVDERTFKEYYRSLHL